MSQPQRIQLRRAKGWRKPAGVIVVSRPSRWGNPFRLDEYRETASGTPVDERKAREKMVRDFRRALGRGELAYTAQDVETELRGKDLACWCPLDLPCHADVLLEVANRAGKRSGKKTTPGPAKKTAKKKVAKR